jgi:hypothetical protein
MPKNKVSDPITDQEIAFARLVLSGAMTDRQAAEAVGLNPDSAAYTKSKPHVRAYMLEHRAAVEQQLVQQEVEGQHRLNLDREKVLDRLWEIAHLSPDMTRGSITGQVKALSMIVAMLDLIPNRRAAESNRRVPEPGLAPGSATEAPPNPTELSSRLPRPAVGPERPVPACRGSVVEGPAVAPGRATEPPPNPIKLSSRPERSVVEGPAVAPALSGSSFARRVPLFTSIPDLGVSLPIKNPFVRPPQSY